MRSKAAASPGAEPAPLARGGSLEPAVEVRPSFSPEQAREVDDVTVLEAGEVGGASTTALRARLEAAK